METTSKTRSGPDAARAARERTESAFTPEDRIGALEMQTISVLDRRALSLHLAEVQKTHEPISRTSSSKSGVTSARGEDG